MDNSKNVYCTNSSFDDMWVKVYTLKENFSKKENKKFSNTLDG